MQDGRGAEGGCAKEVDDGIFWQLLARVLPLRKWLRSHRVKDRERCAAQGFGEERAMRRCSRETGVCVTGDDSTQSGAVWRWSIWPDGDDDEHGLLRMMCVAVEMGPTCLAGAGGHRD